MVFNVMSIVEGNEIDNLGSNPGQSYCFHFALMAFAK